MNFTKCILVLAIATLLLNDNVFSQDVGKTRNLIFVTLDGYRWQELFEGADSLILFNNAYVQDKRVIEMFWSPSETQRREKLMPFVWSTMAQHGQLYGNRRYKNNVNCSNPHLFSYPGYSELFVGYVDRKVKSNDPVENPNQTIFEFIHQQPTFANKVAAFSTWEVIPYIMRASCGIYVNAGKDHAHGENLTEREKMLNEMQELIPSFTGPRYDAFTFQYAMEYLHRERPRVMFIGLDETDEHGHGGRYDEYLKSANRSDMYLKKLWEWIQSQDDYRDQTTLVVTTDHGRGQGHKQSWKRHGPLATGSSQTWLLVMGPDTPALGEIKQKMQLFQKQIATTVTSILGLTYTSDRPVADPVYSAWHFDDDRVGTTIVSEEKQNSTTVVEDPDRP